MRWETHCHTVFSNRSNRRFLDALNTPKEMIEAAIRRGLSGIVITDHDTVRGGLVGKKISKGYRDFTVIPGAEVTSRSGHMLAIGIDEDVPKGLSVEETVERIHDLGGIVVASHPFSTGVRMSLGKESVGTDAIEVFNASNRPEANNKALLLAEEYGKAKSAGSDAHWTKSVGYAGIICEDPVEDLKRGKAQLFGNYSSRLDLAKLMMLKLERSAILRITRRKI